MILDILFHTFHSTPGAVEPFNPSVHPYFSLLRYLALIFEV